MRVAHLAGYLLADILRWQLPSSRDRRTSVPCKTGFTVSTLTNYWVTWHFYFQVFYNTSTTSNRDSLCLGLSSLFTLFCWLLCFVSKGSSTLWWKLSSFDKFSLFPWHCLQQRVKPIRTHNIFSWALLHNFFLRIPLTIPLPCWASRLHTLWSLVLYLPGCRAPSHQEWPSFFSCLWSRVTPQKVSRFTDQ